MIILYSILIEKYQQISFVRWNASGDLWGKHAIRKRELKKTRNFWAIYIFTIIHYSCNAIYYYDGEVANKALKYFFFFSQSVNVTARFKQTDDECCGKRSMSDRLHR